MERARNIKPGFFNNEILGYDDVTANDVDIMLQQLNDNGFIQRYKVPGDGVEDEHLPFN